MYNYKLTCDDYDGSIHLEVCSENLHTREEFDLIVGNCIATVAAKIVKPRSIFEHQREPRFDDVFSDERPVRRGGRIVEYRVRIIEELESFGFKRVEYAAEFKVSGISCINPKKCSENYVGMVRRIRKMFLKLVPNYLSNVKIGKKKEKADIIRAEKRYDARLKKAMNGKK